MPAILEPVGRAFKKARATMNGSAKLEAALGNYAG